MPELRSPWTMPWECKNSIPWAISLMVAVTMGRLGAAVGAIRNHPLVTASCKRRASPSASQIFLHANLAKCTAVPWKW